MRTLAEALLYVAAAFTGGVICSGCVTTSDLRELAAEIRRVHIDRRRVLGRRVKELCLDGPAAGQQQ